jgi:hypothetical protein
VKFEDDGSAVPDPPIHWWRLGESSGTVCRDSTPLAGALNGTYVGTVGATYNYRQGLVNGSPDGAIEFDGVDMHVTLPSGAWTPPFTVVARIVPTITGRTNPILLIDPAGDADPDHVLATKIGKLRAAPGIGGVIERSPGRQPVTEIEMAIDLDVAEARIRLAFHQRFRNAEAGGVAVEMITPDGDRQRALTNGAPCQPGNRPDHLLDIQRINGGIAEIDQFSARGEPADLPGRQIEKLTLPLSPQRRHELAGFMAESPWTKPRADTACMGGIRRHADEGGIARPEGRDPGGFTGKAAQPPPGPCLKARPMATLPIPLHDQRTAHKARGHNPVG